MAGFRVEQVHAFIAITDDGDEGIVGVPTTMGIIPAVAADEDRINSLRPMVQYVCDTAGIRCKLVRFGGAREELETFTPRGAGNA